MGGWFTHPAWTGGALHDLRILDITAIMADLWDRYVGMAPADLLPVPVLPDDDDDDEDDED